MNTVHTDDREIIVSITEKCDEWRRQKHFVFTTRELIERAAADDGVGYNSVKKLGRNVKEDGKAVTIAIRNYQEREKTTAYNAAHVSDFNSSLKGDKSASYSQNCCQLLKKKYILQKIKQIFCIILKSMGLGVRKSQLSCMILIERADIDLG